MDIADFISKFSEQFDDTDAAVFTPETKFKNLDEWSSMLALSVIVMADEEYGKEITGEDIRNSETILDLYNILSAK